MIKVFLGGTTNHSTWRDQLIPLLQVEYFNPVVTDWTEEAKRQELIEREHCDYILYILTPRMAGYYSIAELIDDSNKRPNRTLFCFLPHDVNDEKKCVRFDDEIIESNRAISMMAVMNGAIEFKSLQAVADFLNNAHIRKVS